MGPHSKKRKLNAQVEEITFDPDARQQFLTGFRKRKQQRIKHAQEVAVQKAREAKREDRRKVLEIAVSHSKNVTNLSIITSRCAKNGLQNSNVRLRSTEGS
jgi:hypothetical protein